MRPSQFTAPFFVTSIVISMMFSPLAHAQFYGGMYGGAYGGFSGGGGMMGSGMYGGMQSCPWGYGAADGASEYDDLIDEAKQNLREVKKSAREVQKQIDKLEDRRNKLAENISAGMTGPVADFVFNHMDNGYTCEACPLPKTQNVSQTSVISAGATASASSPNGDGARSSLASGDATSSAGGSGGDGASNNGQSSGGSSAIPAVQSPVQGQPAEVSTQQKQDAKAKPLKNVPVAPGNVDKKVRDQMGGTKPSSTSNQTPEDRLHWMGYAWWEKDISTETTEFDASTAEDTVSLADSNSEETQAMQAKVLAWFSQPNELNSNLGGGRYPAGDGSLATRRTEEGFPPHDNASPSTTESSSSSSDGPGLWDRIVNFFGGGSDQSDSPAATGAKFSRGGLCYNDDRYRENDSWKPLCQKGGRNLKRGEINATVACGTSGRGTDRETRRSIQQCQSSIPRYRQSVERLAKLEKRLAELENQQADLESKIDDYKYQREDEKLADADLEADCPTGECYGKKRSSSSSFKSYLPLILGTVMGGLAEWGGHYVNKKNNAMNERMGWPSQPYLAGSYGFPYFTAGLYGYLNSGVNGGFGCGGGMGGAGFPMGAYGMTGPFGMTGGLYGQGGGAFGYPQGMFGMPMGGGMYMPGMGPWGMAGPWGNGMGMGYPYGGLGGGLNGGLNFGMNPFGGMGNGMYGMNPFGGLGLNGGLGLGNGMYGMNPFGGMSPFGGLNGGLNFGMNPFGGMGNGMYGMSPFGGLGLNGGLGLGNGMNPFGLSGLNGGLGGMDMQYQQQMMNMQMEMAKKYQDNMMAKMQVQQKFTQEFYSLWFRMQQFQSGFGSGLDFNSNTNSNYILPTSGGSTSGTPGVPGPSR